MIDCYKKDGTAISDTLEWAKLFQNKEYKIIKQQKLKCKCFVSTIWLGLDHSFGSGPPLIFETMTFPSNDMDRYATEAQAIVGHEMIVKEHIHKPEDSISGDKNQGR